jgi:adenine-specific DNA-methyltransferase
LNDKPKLFGKAKRRSDSSDAESASVFEEFRREKNGHFLATEAIEHLLKQTTARYVLLSYSSGGKSTAEEFYETINSHGHLLKTMEIGYRKNVMSTMKWTNEWISETQKPNSEFLFLLER